MNAPTRLALFAVAVAAAFALGLGVGDAVGPLADTPAEQHAPQHEAPTNQHGWHAGAGEHQ